jgi:hypothetical protein
VPIHPPGASEAAIEKFRARLQERPLSGELTILSWNVWFNSHCAGDRWRSILFESSKRLPHVLAFQEATPLFVRLLLAEAWVTAGYVCSDGGDGRSCAPEGELLLVRKELQPVFTTTALPSNMSRAMVSAVLPPIGCAVGTAHLESKEENAPTRLLQAKVCRDVLDQNAGGNAIFCGDMNTESSETEHLMEVLGGNWVDVWPVLRSDSAGFTFDSEDNPCASQRGGEPRQARYDRVLIR